MVRRSRHGDAQHCFLSNLLLVKIAGEGSYSLWVFLHRRMENDPLHASMKENLGFHRGGRPLFCPQRSGKRIVMVGANRHWGTLAVNRVNVPVCFHVEH